MFRSFLPQRLLIGRTGRSVADDKRTKTTVEVKRWSLSVNNETCRKAFLELKLLKVIRSTLLFFSISTVTALKLLEEASKQKSRAMTHNSKVFCSLQHLKHRNIAALMNSFLKDTKLYLALEIMQDNLNNIIRAQRLQSDDIRYIIYQILSGLKYLHSCGIIHGDLKPSDIGINKDFSIKIIDLNVERPKEADYVLTKWFGKTFSVVSSPKPSQTTTATFLLIRLSSPLFLPPSRYRSPESLFGWKPSTEKVDLWSLGCIMAEFLCGRIIFAGRDRKFSLKLSLSTKLSCSCLSPLCS